MNEYIATFWTHFSAISTLRTMKAAAIKAEARPVPRDLSASCGICVRYIANEPCTTLLHDDFEAVYECVGERSYKAVLQNVEIK